MEQEMLKSCLFYRTSVLCVINLWANRCGPVAGPVEMDQQLALLVWTDEWPCRYVKPVSTRWYSVVIGVANGSQR